MFDSTDGVCFVFLRFFVFLFWSWSTNRKTMQPNQKTCIYVLACCASKICARLLLSALHFTQLPVTLFTFPFHEKRLWYEITHISWHAQSTQHTHTLASWKRERENHIVWCDLIFASLWAFLYNKVIRHWVGSLFFVCVYSLFFLIELVRCARDRAHLAYVMAICLFFSSWFVPYIIPHFCMQIGSEEEKYRIHCNIV